MEISHISQEYIQAVKDIKNAILKSRYMAAKKANQELLKLYYSVGGYVSTHSRDGYWGSNAIETISKGLQQELPGLRGFSATNIKNMRIFYEQWCPYLNRQSMSDDLIDMAILSVFSIRQTLSDEFPIDDFMSVGFSQHMEIIFKTSTLEERLFYIHRCAIEFWGYRELKRQIKSDLYHKEGSIKQTNFNKTISDNDFKRKALQSFKDEYLLDFVNIEDPEEVDERIIEQTMGVATYRTSSELPKELREALPDIEDLKKLL